MVWTIRVSSSVWGSRPSLTGAFSKSKGFGPRQEKTYLFIDLRIRGEVMTKAWQRPQGSLRKKPGWGLRRGRWVREREEHELTPGLLDSSSCWSTREMEAYICNWLLIFTALCLKGPLCSRKLAPTLCKLQEMAVEQSRGVKSQGFGLNPRFYFLWAL